MKDQKEWCSIRTLSTGVRYGKTADLAIEMYAKMNEMKQDQTIALVSTKGTRIFKLVEIRGNKKGVNEKQKSNINKAKKNSKLSQIYALGA